MPITLTRVCENITESIYVQSRSLLKIKYSRSVIKIQVLDYASSRLLFSWQKPWGPWWSFSSWVNRSCLIYISNSASPPTRTGWNMFTFKQKLIFRYCQFSNVVIDLEKSNLIFEAISLVNISKIWINYVSVRKNKKKNSHKIVSRIELIFFQLTN